MNANEKANLVWYIEQNRTGQLYSKLIKDNE